MRRLVWRNGQGDDVTALVKDDTTPEQLMRRHRILNSLAKIGITEWRPPDFDGKVDDAVFVYLSEVAHTEEVD